MVRQLGFMVVAVVVLWGSTADAGMIRWQFTGSVDHADAGNDFGLSVTDTITGYAIFDDSVLLGGTGEIELGESGNAFGGELSFTVGEFMFEEKDDIDFHEGKYPTIEIVDGEVIAFDFVVGLEEDDFFVGPVGFRIGKDDLSFLGVDQSGNTINGMLEGSIDLDYTGSGAGGEPIPEPGTLALLGLGAAAAGLAKRRRQKRAAA